MHGYQRHAGGVLLRLFVTAVQRGCVPRQHEQVPNDDWTVQCVQHLSTQTKHQVHNWLLLVNMEALSKISGFCQC